MISGARLKVGGHRLGKYREHTNHAQSLEYIPYQAIIQAQYSLIVFYQDAFGAHHER